MAAHCVSMTFTAGGDYGEYLHALTEKENGPHSHNYYSPVIQPVQSVSSGNTYGNYNKQYKIQTDSSGEGRGHNNIQPSRAVYYWHRTA